MIDEVCVVIPVGFSAGSYRTAIESFRKFYRTVTVLIVSNVAKESEITEIEEFAQQFPHVTNTIFFPKKIPYGEALHEAINKVNHRFIFLMDHTTQTRSGRFLEEMTKLLASSEKIYGTGKALSTEHRGMEIAVLDERFMMIKRKEYHHLAPFGGNKNVMLKNFSDAAQRGYELRNFPIQQYLSQKEYSTSSIKKRAGSLFQRFGF
ncbi:MAG: hypothetical protein AB1728_00625 [Bacteroidota bacterium]